MASLGGGRTQNAPGDTIQGVTPEIVAPSVSVLQKLLDCEKELDAIDGY